MGSGALPLRLGARAGWHGLERRDDGLRAWRTMANGHRALSQEPKQEPKTFPLSFFNKGKQVRRATEPQP